MKKLLYLHGLNSTLHDDRREALEKYDIQIVAPSLDYEQNPNVLQDLLADFPDVELVIGSSAGGLAGYYFSGVLGVPALLFNPALPFRNQVNQLPALPKRNSFLQVVIGAQDQEVDAKQNFELLLSDFNPENPAEIHWINQMAHSLPIEIFSKEVEYFFNCLEIKSATKK